MPNCKLSEKAELTLSLLLLLAAVIFGFYILWPLTQPGYTRGGDDVIHMAYSHEAAKILLQKHALFGWSYLFGFGAPIFLFRPPLQYLCEAAIQCASGGALSLSMIHKCFYLVCLAMYPAGIFYMMRKFRFPPLACGIAALFSLTPISMWGHTLHAYFWLGVMKQLIAIFLFPIALGRVHATVSDGKRVLPTSLVIAAAFLSHPYIPFCLMLVCAVYWLVVLAGRGWQAALLAGVRMALVWGLTALLLAFYLVPFYTSPEIQQQEFSYSWRHSFEVVCETTAMTINHFFSGAIFDTSRWSVYGGGEWGWPDNTFTGRLPILSAMCLLGILVCIWRRRQFAHAVLVLAATVTLFVFLGPDDVTLLNYVPFQDQFQNIHAVFMLDYFAICLAGIGAAALVQGLAQRLVGAVCAVAGIRPPPAADAAAAPVCSGKGAWRTAQALVLCLAALGTFAVLYSPYRDRLLVARRIAVTQRFDTRNGELTPSTAQQSVWGSLQKIQRILQDPAYPGRFYASAQDQDSTASGRELFAFSILPALAGRTDVICGFFSAEVAGVNKTVIENFRPQMPRYRNLIELFNVRYLLCATPNAKKLAGVEAYADVAMQDAYWTLWRARGDYGHFALLARKPFLVYASLTDWRRFCHLWVDAFKDTADPARFPYFVYGGSGQAKGVAPDAQRYAGVVLLAGASDIEPAVLSALRAFAAAGGRLFAVEPVADLPATWLPGGVEGFRFSDFLADREFEGTCRESIAERERHGARVETPRPAFAVFKMAYYRSWAASVDGKETDLVELSPGFCGTHVPEGAHELSFVYRGPNNHRMGWLVSAAGLFAALAILAVQRRKRSTWEAWLPAPLARALSGGTGAIRAGLVTLMLAGAGVFLLRGYILEQFLHVPVPTRPTVDCEVPTDILLDWNLLKQQPKATYDVQIDDVSRQFGHVVYEQAGLSVNYARKTSGLMPGHRYWWRVRSNVDGKPSPWCRPITFHTPPPRVRPDMAGPYFIRTFPRPAEDKGLVVQGESNLPDGVLIHVRLYRPDTMVRIQSTDVRLVRGAFTGMLRQPAGGWQYSGQALLICDCVYPMQDYPAAGELGPYGRDLLQRGVAPGHKLLYGLAAATEALAGQPAPGTDAPALAAALSAGKPDISVSAGFDASGKLRVVGRTTLPNQSQLRVRIRPRTHAEPVARRDVETAEGRFIAVFEAVPSRDYVVEVLFTPDVQYQAVRRQVGESGESVERKGSPAERRMYGLRSELTFPLGP